MAEEVRDEVIFASTEETWVEAEVGLVETGAEVGETVVAVMEEAPVLVLALVEVALELPEPVPPLPEPPLPFPPLPGPPLPEPPLLLEEVVAVLAVLVLTLGVTAPPPPVDVVVGLLLVKAELIYV